MDILSLSLSNNYLLLFIVVNDDYINGNGRTRGTTGLLGLNRMGLDSKAGVSQGSNSLFIFILPYNLKYKVGGQS
ncbi:hypothetical protein HanRHA438_Chr04g0199021 [Helianthus annuus]|nr:hypothetical protein HanIR_Chr04g0203971 [Helianthus annuus]KAJ0928894.1 hypothetical protein HanRHA438_Chr04g0199021 [Helianthus annuus]